MHAGGSMAAWTLGAHGLKGGSNRPERQRLRSYLHGRRRACGRKCVRALERRICRVSTYAYVRRLAFVCKRACACAFASAHKQVKTRVRVHARVRVRVFHARARIQCACACLWILEQHRGDASDALHERSKRNRRARPRLQFTKQVSAN
eukprot:6198425-Pleurochrysis_carterae.AAC.1